MQESKIVLNRRQFGIDTQMPRGVEVQTRLEDEMGRALFKLRAEVLAHRLDTASHVLVVKVPATAWDHVKAEWLPTFTRWFKWDVNERVVVKDIFVEDFHTFPDATVRYPPELGEPVIHQYVTESQDDWVRPANFDGDYSCLTST